MYKVIGMADERVGTVNRLLLSRLTSVAPRNISLQPLYYKNHHITPQFPTYYRVYEGYENLVKQQHGALVLFTE